MVEKMTFKAPNEVLAYLKKDAYEDALKGVP